MSFLYMVDITVKGIAYYLERHLVAELMLDLPH